MTSTPSPAARLQSAPGLFRRSAARPVHARACGWLGPTLALVVTLFAPSVGGQGQSTPPAPTGTGLIIGRVVDGDAGQPLGGAVVRVTLPATGRRQGASGDTEQMAFAVAGGVVFQAGAGNAQTTLAMMTDADGWFVFRDLPAGSLNFNTTLLGYAGGGYNQHQPDGPAQAFPIADGQQVSDLVLRMWKLGTISGTVTDEAGEPVIGTFVRILRYRILGGQPVLSMSGGGQSTDDRGQFRAFNLMPGDYVVSVPAGTTAVPASAVQALPATQNSFFDGAQPFMGPAMNGSGAPNVMGTGQRVGNMILQTGAGMSGLVPPPASSSGQLFVYPTVFYPNATSSSHATVITLKSGEARTGVDMVLPLLPTVRVSGSVNGPDGPVRGVGVHIVTADADQGFLADTSPDDVATSMTDPGGQFTLLGVPRGQYLLKVIRGAGRGMVQAPDGTFSLQSNNDPTLWAAVPVVVDQADVTGLVISLQPGVKVSGRVVFDGASTQPSATQLQRPGVRLLPAQPGGGRMGNPGMANQQSLINPDGTFSSAGLVPGRYSVIAPTWPLLKWIVKDLVADGKDVSDAPLDITGSDVTSLVVTLTDQPAQLSGVVRDLSSRPDPNALVVVFPADRRAWGWPNGIHTKNAHVTTTGTYTLTRLPPGDYELAAIPDGWQSSWQDPTMLERIAASATLVHLKVGETRTEDLRTATIR